jgi:hypothetical protein
MTGKIMVSLCDIVSPDQHANILLTAGTAIKVQGAVVLGKATIDPSPIMVVSTTNASTLAIIASTKIKNNDFDFIKTSDL